MASVPRFRSFGDRAARVGTPPRAPHTHLTGSLASRSSPPHSTFYELDRQTDKVEWNQREGECGRYKRPGGAGRVTHAHCLPRVHTRASEPRCASTCTLALPPFPRAPPCALLSDMNIPINLQQTRAARRLSCGTVVGEEERVHQCGECGLTLSTRSALTAHARSHRATADAHRCDVCHKTFAVPARLVRHYRTHTGERPFECEYCHKMFSVKENLQVHRRIHTKERPYRCGVCDAAFEHSGKLHRHARIHTGERPHACPHCHKTFIQSGQLVIHLRTHTGEKPYRCPAPGCGKGFTCSKQLKVHSRTHTGERPYTCDICLRDFGYNHVLKLHRFQHYGERCYRCTVCDGTFNTKKQMEAHIYKEHGADTPRTQAISSAGSLIVNGNVCDLVEAALQQLPPTPPSSPPSPQCPAVPSVTTMSPSPSLASTVQYTLAPSSLPPRKRKLIPQPDIEMPVVRHTSVIQFAPAAVTES